MKASKATIFIVAVLCLTGCGKREYKCRCTAPAILQIKSIGKMKANDGQARCRTIQFQESFDTCILSAD